MCSVTAPRRQRRWLPAGERACLARRLSLRGGRCAVNNLAALHAPPPATFHSAHALPCASRCMRPLASCSLASRSFAPPLSCRSLPQSKHASACCVLLSPGCESYNDDSANSAINLRSCASEQSRSSPVVLAPFCRRPPLLRHAALSSCAALASRHGRCLSSATRARLNPSRKPSRGRSGRPGGEPALPHSAPTPWTCQAAQQASRLQSVLRPDSDGDWRPGRLPAPGAAAGATGGRWGATQPHPEGHGRAECAGRGASAQDLGVFPDR